MKPVCNRDRIVIPSSPPKEKPWGTTSSMGKFAIREHLSQTINSQKVLNETLGSRQKPRADRIQALSDSRQNGCRRWRLGFSARVPQHVILAREKLSRPARRPSLVTAGFATCSSEGTLSDTLAYENAALRSWLRQGACFVWMTRPKCGRAADTRLVSEALSLQSGAVAVSAPQSGGKKGISGCWRFFSIST